MAKVIKIYEKYLLRNFLSSESIAGPIDSILRIPISKPLISNHSKIFLRISSGSKCLPIFAHESFNDRGIPLKQPNRVLISSMIVAFTALFDYCFQNISLPRNRFGFTGMCYSVDACLTGIVKWNKADQNFQKSIYDSYEVHFSF